MNRSVDNNDKFELTQRYEILRQVGGGLLGVVYEMLDRETGAAAAAKLLTHARPDDAGRFRREFEALGRLDHPHLARYIDLINRDGANFLIEEFVDGVDLLSYLRLPPTPEEREALELREAKADGGLADDSDIPPSGPIEVDLDSGEVAEEGEEGSHADDSEASMADAPPMEAGADEDERADSRELSSDEAAPQPSEPDTADDSIDLELAREAAAQPSDAPEAGGESTADIVANIAADEAKADQVPLDLVLLRLERVLPQLVDALEHLHRFRKQHGNLKPNNILVDRSGRCLLTDYGLLGELVLFSDDNADSEDDGTEQERPDLQKQQLPKLAAPELAADEEPLLEAGPPPEASLRRTFSYRAPETLGLDEASPQADLYALGCVLFEAIGGEPPFAGSPADIHDKQLNAEPRSLSELEPHCPASWADIIHGLLDKSPQRRPSLAEVRELVEYSESYAVDIPPSAVPEQEFFFGRSELVDDVLSEIKQSYQQKRLGVTVLRGSPGVGKTAISQAVSYLASRRGWLVLTGKCYNRESLIYQGWDEIAAQIARIFQELPEDLQQKADACRRQASTLFPVLRFEGDPQPRDLDRLDAIDSFRSLLKRLSSQRPLLLLMDDLHWASWDTSSLLLDLVGEPHGLRCMVLGTWLDGQASARSHPLVRGLRTAPAPVQWFDVTGFSKDEAREYVISAGSHLSLQDQRRVLRRGEFNPLLLEELIHDIGPDAIEGAELDELLAAPGEADSPVTEKLTEVLDKRIEALSRRERFVLEILSVASIPLSGAIISTTLNEEFHSDQSVENTARDALNRLLEARFVRTTDSHHWEVAYTVAHNIYREHILGQLREQRYSHLCRRIAEGLRRCWPSAEELRFEYLLRAGQVREAADSAIRAARASEERFAFNRAAKLWRWLTENAGHTSVSPDVRPRAEHARMEFRAQRFLEAAGLYHEVVRETENDHERIRLLCAEFEASLHAARHEQGREALDRALGTLGESYLDNGLLTKLSEVKDRAVAATSRWTDDLSDAKVEAADKDDQLRAELYRMGIDAGDLLDARAVDRFRTRLSVLAEKTLDARLMGLDRLYLAAEASRHGGRRKQQRVANWFSEAATLFEQAGDWEMRAVTEVESADHLRLLGHFEQAEERLMMAAKYFRGAGKRLLRQRYLVKLTHAKLLLDQGLLEDAAFVARQLLHFARGDAYVTFRAYQVLVPCYMTQGRTALVEKLLDHCRKLLAETPTSVSQVWLARMEAQFNIALGRPEVAAGKLDVLAEDMHQCRLIGEPHAETMLHLSLGQALAALAEREQALIQHRRTETLQRLKESVRLLEADIRQLPVATQAEVRRLSARYELLRNNPKKAQRLLDTAVSRLVGYDNAIERAKCLEARGFIHRRMELSDAPNLIDLAQQTYAYYGARLPLFLEGWPVPSDYSSLCKDED